MDDINLNSVFFSQVSFQVLTNLSSKEIQHAQLNLAATEQLFLIAMQCWHPNGTEKTPPQTDERQS